MRALEHVIAMDKAQHMLDRDIAVVDLREEGRPVVQIGLDAQNAIRRARGQDQIGPDGKPIEPGTDAAGKSTTKTASRVKKT